MLLIIKEIQCLDIPAPAEVSELEWKVGAGEGCGQMVPASSWISAHFHNPCVCLGLEVEDGARAR